MEGVERITVRRWDLRAILFRVIASACALLLLNFGGVASIIAPWGSPGFSFPGFTPEIHRWHSALLGVTEAILLPGLLLALLWRPRERPQLMQFFVLAGVALVSAHLLTRGSTPVSSAFIVFPVLAFPALRALLRFPPLGRPSATLLALGVVAAVPLGLDAWHNLRTQLAGAGGEHARQGHWATACSLDVVLVLAVLLAAGRRPGWRALGWLAAVALLYLGVAAISLPGHAGSWGVRGGGLAILGGVALVVAVCWEGRDVRARNGHRKEAESSRPSPEP